MSTLTMRWPPTRVKLWSVSTRRILACAGIGMSAISSRNRVPPWACSSRPGPGELAPLLDPEQFLLDPLGRHPRGADDDEGRLGARAPIVEQPRRHLLADAGRTGDQHPAAGRGDPLQRRADGVDRDAGAGQLGFLADLRRSVAFSRRSRSVSVARATRWSEMPGLERLFDEVDRALADRRDRGVEIAVAGDHQHRQGRIAPLDLLEQLQPVELRALQPDVEQDQRRPPLGQRRQRLAAVGGGPRANSPRPPARPETRSRMSCSSSTMRMSSAMSNRSAACSAGCVVASPPQPGERFGVEDQADQRAAAGASSNSMLPKCSSTIFLTMARPRPVPLARVVI